ncbi:hypothetical protein BH23ACT9_BH23ACT9_31340 [soil metagenome]
MTILQAWMLIGIPALALAGAAFIRRSFAGSAIGYVALLAGLGGMAVYDRFSAAVFGGVVALLFAAGRGGSIEREPDRMNEEGVPDAALHPTRRSGSPA